MKFSEIPKEIAKFTQEQLAERQKRLSDPILQAQLDRTKTLLLNDFKSACGNGLEACYRFAIAGPVSSLWEGTKELGGVVAHNMSVKKEKNKKSYSQVPAAMIVELLSQWGKGGVSTAKMVGNLSLTLGRGTVLGSRYLIGK